MAQKSLLFTIVQKTILNIIFLKPIRITVKLLCNSGRYFKKINSNLGMLSLLDAKKDYRYLLGRQ